MWETSPHQSFLNVVSTRNLNYRGKPIPLLPPWKNKKQTAYGVGLKRTIRGFHPLITPRKAKNIYKIKKDKYNRGRKASSSVQRGKEFPLVNPFLFASAITFLPLLNASIDYKGVYSLITPQKQKKKTKDLKSK